ncbi:MAG: cytidine deaminase [Myxococcales bacterium FL481]|nr:MAG: cytidine deaminase [Myxococcales bacterium FL481]
MNPASRRSLLDMARDAAANAYCKYSGFAVGAAVRSVGGRVFVGCNVENASYGLTSCAERNAIFAMIAAGEREIAEIVVYTPTDQPTAPCGACRQVIWEFGRDAVVVMACDGAPEREQSIRELLPDAFGADNLSPGEPEPARPR